MLKYFAFFGSFCHVFPISHGGVKSFGICCWINLNSLMDSSSQVAQLFSTDDQLVSIKTFKTLKVLNILAFEILGVKTITSYVIEF